MYPVSDEFHAAVRNGNPQKAMLIFGDAVFTDGDISVDRGIQFRDYFNTDKNLRIGQTPSNEIQFSLFNDLRYLNNYTFGDFLATIGVLLGRTEFTTNGNAYVRTLYADYTGFETYPYLLRNGRPVDAQPGWVVSSLMGYDGKLWAFSPNGDWAVYADATGENITERYSLNTFMRAKVRGWLRKGYYYNAQSRRLMIYDDETGIRDLYEFCPLGWFFAERPNAPDKIEISMTCYDLMQRFDQDMPTAAKLGISYPTTIGELYRKMCDYVALPCRTTEFINSGTTIGSEPEEFSNSTMRTVLGWIAEAAASNARIDRDGFVTLDWIRNTGQRYAEGDYSEFEPYWYTTQKVTKLYNRDTSEAEERTLGSGDEAYLIQDNPLMRNAV